MKKYIIKKCDIKNLSLDSKKTNSYFENNIQKYSDKEYLYWDEIKFKPVPKEFKDNKELWGYIKFMRQLNYVSPIKTEDGKYFRFGELAFSNELLHEIDKNASGTFFGISSRTDKKLFLFNGTLEEAISSSQLEGASTTTKVAKDMIRRNRKPRTKDEQMILNNYEMMNYLRTELIKKDLEIGDLLYLQTILTKNTLEDENDSGRFRNNKDNIVVQFEGKISHIPPSEKFLKQELQRLVDFANDKLDSNTFIHPVIKAIILHFWIGYLHPFCDGNGRTARALFYWYLLRNDYFWFSYIPLSKEIKETRKKYAKAYIYAEQDNLDLNYFISYNLSRIKLALEKFNLEVKNKFKENEKNIRKLSSLGLNERQIRLINHLLENKESYTNATTHQNFNKIARPTAISDLKNLEKKGLIISIKSGRNINYFPVDDLEEIVK